ncbi:MAG TPA: chain length determinant protein EpsF [Burkholderiales bacterium]|nr:chain length determinant protein EpsF [Burkholderiales bacterium]
MNLRQYFFMFRVRWRLAVGILLGTVAIAVPVILMLPKQYTASTSLGVEIKSPDFITTVLMPTNLASQEEIIRSERVTRQVIRTLGFDIDPGLRQTWQQVSGRGRYEEWLAEVMQRRLTVTPSRRGDNMITIQYRSPSPAEAAAVANAYARHYAEAAIEMKVEPARQYARWFGEQNKKLRADFEAAQARLSAFQREKGIGVRDENLGAEAERLANLAAQLTAAQTVAVDAKGKLQTGGDALPEVMQNTVIQGLRAEILRQEAKLRDAGANLGANHPQYRAMQAEVAELKVRLDAETRHVVRSVSTTRSLSGDKERELKTALEAQRKKLLAMRADRDLLAVLERDVEGAKQAYETAERRFTQVNLESQATQSNVFLIRPAIEPLEPSFPKVKLYILASILFGALLGVATAHALETLDRRVRCVDDVAGLMRMRVLSVVERDASPGTLALQRRNAPLALPRQAA